MRSLLGQRSSQRLLAALALTAPLVWAAFMAPCAHAQATAAKPVLVVIQSGIPGDGGNALRAQLAQQFQLEVVSVRSGQLSQTPPLAMLTLALDEHAVLNALYWDREGGFDQLSAPAPKQPEALATAALTLAAALVQRNLDTMNGLRDQPNARSLPDQAELQRAALYSALMRREHLGRLGIELRVEDF